LSKWLNHSSIFWKESCWSKIFSIVIILADISTRVDHFMADFYIISSPLMSFSCICFRSVPNCCFSLILPIVVYLMLLKILLSHV
jgi:hypothetical protein